MMNSILGDFLDKFALVYLTTSLSSAVPKKTISSMFGEFNKTELEFVGFQVSAQGILAIQVQGQGDLRVAHSHQCSRGAAVYRFGVSL
ncbi:hypothetical protein O0I10_005470 [Lichtheimia ornata]|uniref:Uncharacterized protein n=1 Tax=Lichtheimia ornata TaxID=688661 RepID=A0AAD7XZJ5_9FUNG|nr:uncharacterized protein O0I10_005470 [Lichtheimia ornata]KAJ8658746.1 hypothetical protein O0I10_005470 [Lichtheimia ornata]